MDALIEQTLTRSAEVKALSEERGNSNEIKELIIAMRTGFDALTHQLTCALIHSFIHSLTHSLTHN